MLSGVILAGGAHLGTNGMNRAFLELGGGTLLDRQIREMRVCCDEITIVAEDPRLFLRSVDRDIRIISDYYRGSGLLSGFHAGIALAGHEFVWVLGCHIPFPSAAAAKLLHAKLAAGGEAAIPWIEGALLPLHAVYHGSVSESSGKLLEEGRSDFRGLLKELHVVESREREFEKAGIASSFARSVRTEEDYRSLERETAATREMF
jgi:molybdopterin-guanine dinucleotide biosynthesis protein A